MNYVMICCIAVFSSLLASQAQAKVEDRKAVSKYFESLVGQSFKNLKYLVKILKENDDRDINPTFIDPISREMRYKTFSTRETNGIIIGYRSYDYGSSGSNQIEEMPRSLLNFLNQVDLTKSKDTRTDIVRYPVIYPPNMDLILEKVVWLNKVYKDNVNLGLQITFKTTGNRYLGDKIKITIKTNDIYKTLTLEHFIKSFDSAFQKI